MPLKKNTSFMNEDMQLLTKPTFQWQGWIVHAMDSKLIFSLLLEKNSLVLVLDRTNWKLGEKNVNILMLRISYENVAFPLIFKMLDKIGNSNSCERITLIQNFIDWFGKDCIDCLLVDREFVDKEWLAFL